MTSNPSAPNGRLVLERLVIPVMLALGVLVAYLDKLPIVLRSTHDADVAAIHRAFAATATDAKERREAIDLQLRHLREQVDDLRWRQAQVLQRLGMTSRPDRP